MTQSRLTARPTLYKGIQMRSRLEAAFAGSLDLKGFVWAYESECFADETGQYLPDFQILDDGFEAPFYIEVKPDAAHVDLDAALERMHIIRATHPQAVLYVHVGDSRTGFRAARSCQVGNTCPDCNHLEAMETYLDHRDRRRDAGWEPAVGLRVVHPTFGEGWITSASFYHDDVVVDFDDVGKKELSLSVAAGIGLRPAA